MHAIIQIADHEQRTASIVLNHGEVVWIPLVIHWNHDTCRCGMPEGAFMVPNFVPENSLPLAIVDLVERKGKTVEFLD